MPSAIWSDLPAPVPTSGAQMGCIKWPEDLKIEKAEMLRQTLDCEAKALVHLRSRPNPFGNSQYRCALGIGDRVRNCLHLTPRILEGAINLVPQFGIEPVREILLPEAISRAKALHRADHVCEC